MAKKSWLKAVVGIGAVAVAGKVVYDRYKNVKEAYTQEENESIDDDVKKYNAVCQKKLVEVEDEEFKGCEIKTVGSNMVVDLGLATFEKDVYINFTSKVSNLTIILPEGVNVACDVDTTCSGVRNLVENVDEDGIYTVYVIGRAVGSNVEIIPVNFYVDDEDIEGLDDDDFSEDDFIDESEEGIGSKLSALAGKAKGVVETVKEKAAPVVETVKEKAAPVVETVKEKAAPVVETVKEKAAPVVETVKEKAAPVMESASEKAGIAAGKVKGLFGRGKEVVEDAVEDVEETVETVADTVADTVEETVADTVEKVVDQE